MPVEMALFFMSMILFLMVISCNRHYNRKYNTGYELPKINGEALSDNGTYRKVKAYDLLMSEEIDAPFIRDNQSGTYRECRR